MWKFWPTHLLQQEIGSKSFDSFQRVIPLVGGERGLFFESSKSSLIKVISAIAPEDYFRKRKNFEKCFHYLPNQTLIDLCSILQVQFHDDREKLGKYIYKKLQSDFDKYIKFCEYFDIPSRFFGQPEEKKPSYQFARGPKSEYPLVLSRPYKVLKNYQASIFLRASEKMETPRCRMILKMPTGSGKTRTAMELIVDHFRSINVESETPVQVVWLANSRELCEQAISCFVELWEHVGQSDVKICRLWEGHDPESSSDVHCDQRLIVASLQSMGPVMADAGSYNFNLMADTSLLIVDEAHIAVAPGYAETIKHIALASECKILGLTATPGRTNEEEVTELSELFHGNIVDLEDPAGIWDNPIRYLRSLNVLASTQYEPLDVPPSVKFTKQELKNLSERLDFPPRVLKELGASEVRNAEIVLRLRKELRQGARVLLFSPSLEASKFLSSMFSFLGFRSAHVDGGTPNKTRDYFIEEFVNGNIQILCNYGVLATGFDAPSTDVVCIARPTISPVLYSQMIGRGLRGPAVGGTEICKIIEVRDNFENLGSQDEMYRYFDDHWAE